MVWVVGCGFLGTAWAEADSLVYWSLPEQTLSGDPAEDERLDKLLFRLEWDIPASVPQNVITVVFEPGESRGHWERLPTGSFCPENSELYDQT